MTLKPVMMGGILMVGCIDGDLELDQSVEETSATPTLGAAEEIFEPPVGLDLPRGGYQVTPFDFKVNAGASVDSEFSASALAAPVPLVVYMNRFGGVYTHHTNPWWNDAESNATSIPFSAVHGSTSTISSWIGSDAAWAEVMSCVRSQFAAYNVIFTEEDPGSTPHIESVVAGYDYELGVSAGGIATMWGDCSLYNSTIVFTFASLYTSYGYGPRTICETATQELGHAMGLDHEYYCKDPMTYLAGCGNKTFQDVDVACGEYSSRACLCSATQNSVDKLYDTLGAKDQPPTLAITSPSEAAEVAPGFAVHVTASDDYAVVKVQLYIDGSLYAYDTSLPYVFVTPSSLALGEHTLKVVAKDAYGHSEKIRTVTVVGEAGDAGAPNPDDAGFEIAPDASPFGDAGESDAQELSLDASTILGNDSDAASELTVDAGDAEETANSSGGGCTTGGGSPWWAVLMVVCLLWRRSTSKRTLGH